MPRFLLAALAAAVSLLAASPSIAHAGTPCAKRVIDDWTKDGQINGNYSKHCLRQAYRNVPPDLADYSSILDDITAAMIGSGPTQNGPNNPGGPTGTSSPGGKLTPKEAQRRAERAVPQAGKQGSIPDSSRTLPLPLLILAAVTLAALLAAASPPLIQRLRTRFVRARPAPQTDRN
ncbi:MAG: hypothetical protein E6G02_14605 [Actinobacteria bacterium]|nr:MAG: hypothetical protein E6G02_14605 [Actinomycetota bacterium]